MLKTILAFAAGGAIGAGVTYAILHDKYQKQYQKDWEELHAGNAEKSRPIESEGVAKDEKEEDLPKPIEEKIFRYGGSSVVPTMNPFPSEEADGVTDYGKFSRIAKEEAEDSEDDEPDREERTHDREPYLISEEEFATKCSWHDKNELTYYAADDILADEDQDGVIADPGIMDLIGPSAIPELIRTRDTVYIRNDKVASDYMINYLDESWPGC